MEAAVLIGIQGSGKSTITHVTGYGCFLGTASLLLQHLLR